MKLFCKRYVSALFISAALYAVTLLCCLFYTASFADFFSPSLIISLLLGLLIRLTDDINDYYRDVINHKTLFSRRTLITFISVDIVSIISVIIAFRRFYFFIPVILIASLFICDNKYVKALILPTISFIVFYYCCGIRYAIIPLVVCGFIASVVFAFIKKPQELKSEDVGGKAYNLSKIRGCRIPPFIVIPHHENDEERIYAYIKSFCKGNKKYAIRSSGADEDSENGSFAGVHKSYLNVGKHDVYKHILLVKESGGSERVEAYRKYNNLEKSGGKISVIVQEMVPADYAGVIFTINPVTNDVNETVISVCKGLGDKLVDGQADGTTYYFNGIKETVKGEDVLSGGLKRKLLKLSEVVANQTDRFQDMEFAVSENKVYLLQTRAIATYKDINPHKIKLIIDNSNIIESYYDVTSPLTFSFAQEIYGKVYSETLKLGKVRRKITDSLNDSLNNMLFYHDGRIYYNLKSWYHVTSIFPMKKSTKYMESMMGVKTSVKENKRVKLNIFDAAEILFIFLDKLKNIDNLSDEFICRFDEITKPYYGREINLKNDELKKLYEDIEQKIIPEFTTPIINDCAVMFYFGRLKEKAAKYENSADIINECVNNNGDVESAKSTVVIEEIAGYVRKNEEIKNDFLTLTEEKLFKKYYLSDNELSEKLHKYVYDYGPRVMNELKLETVTMIENPSLVITLLKNTLISERKSVQNNHTEIPESLRKLSAKAKHYIQNRERLRLRRTYMFSVVRNIFLAYGRNYFDEGRIDAPGDIFYLTKEEILGDVRDVRKLIEERKRSEEEYKKRPYYNRVVFFENRTLPVSSVSAAGGLSGIPSGAGVVKAKVCLINSPSNKFEPGSIILTKRTDPGWIVLFPQAAGLIVEHGSMLSHSFVVAREMGLPAVVNVPDATRVIKDGDVVTLDGIKGEIKVER